MVEVLRTPDDRFVGLPDYDFAPHYTEVAADDGTALRFHHVEEGPADGSPVLLMHGNPSWSYLHRHMVRGLAARGHRVVALDLMGLGRSDKPTDRSFFTLARHVDLVSQWVVANDLRHATLYCQDWGGTIGLNVLAREGDRFDRVIASNTGLPVGEGVNAFMQQWLDFSQAADELPIGALVRGGVTRLLSDAEAAAYDAPFPDKRYQASALEFPLLIPVQPDNPGVPQCRDTWTYLEAWTKPFLTVFGTDDMVAYKPGAHRKLQRLIPGAQSLDHIEIEGANHFIQEDAPERLVEIIDTFIRTDGT
ncbi:MAG: haloalkane dehalogenase [Actinomycetes bacterium]